MSSSRRGTMRILAGIFLLMIFAALVVSTAAAQELEWDKIYGTPSNDLASSVDQTTDGGYIIAGFTHAYGAEGTVLLIKTDSNGNQMWTSTFGGEEWDFIYVVHQTTDGGYIMAGTTKSFGAGDGDLWLIKTDSSGNEVWSRTFGGSNYDGCYDVKQTTDGGYILVGDTSSFGVVSYDLWLIKTDSFGHKTWEKFFSGTNWDYGRSVWQTTDGGYIIAGDTSSYGPNEYDIWLIKTNSAGTMMWNRMLGGTEGDQVQVVQQTADGGYIVAGNTYSFGSGDNDIWLIKTNSAGNITWDKTFGGTSAEVGRSVQQTTDGGYIVAGWTRSYGEGDKNAWLIKIDSSGLANITLQAPADGAVLTSPPTFSWTPNAGANNVFAVDLSYDWTFSWYWSTYGNMHQLISEESWTMPQQLWNFIPSGSYVYWRVRGADLQSNPPAIVTSSEVWWFYKWY